MTGIFTPAYSVSKRTGSDGSPSRSRAGCRHSSLPGRCAPPRGKPQAGCDDSAVPVVTVSCSPTGADKPTRPPTLDRLLPTGTDDTQGGTRRLRRWHRLDQIESALSDAL